LACYDAVVSVSPHAQATGALPSGLYTGVRICDIFRFPARKQLRAGRSYIKFV